ncbi:rod shape-determining protein MreC [Gelidibacter salicanalis]|uniref:Cell shape-determining protein MreC n=1 Tax=Gelidibacter salicanalis TaxID=291193 RepID=A0A934KS18_9FLAO|nr:rod shape-determining protein MreC [Gelidibacter salicanalis]MBJ7879068.1 rod shape-determining protein MreC [Gelidibacter salicanalis]
MQQIINFVLRNKTFLVFLLLFGLSLFFTIQSHSYHKSKFVNSSNMVTGSVYQVANGIGQYFNLADENKALLEENRMLKTIVHNLKLDTIKLSVTDSLKFNSSYKFRSAEVYKNSYSQTTNYLTINKGKKDSIKVDYGVITSQGIVGIVENTSRNFSSVLSILNTRSRINAQLKKTNHIGSLVWNTESAEFAQLIDISKFAPVAIGDTIVTGGQSTIFPKGVLIGTVNSFKIDTGGDSYIVNVKLFNDMTNIGHVYVIENLKATEIKSLQKPKDD